MKTWTGLVLAILLTGCATAEPAKGEPRKPGEGMRFVFLAVLEGLYEDGVANDDVERILLRSDEGRYENFIYACEICTATIWALEAYRARPEQFYGWKMQTSTFGPGLPESVRKRLRRSDAETRLAAINALVRRWMDRRLERTRLSRGDRAKLRGEIEAMRERGMLTLKNFRAAGAVAENAPVYADTDECAACNGAAGFGMP